MKYDQLNSLVSVLIPVYNVERYVEIAVRSIINQTYNNLEIIIIDDASTDETFNIISRLALEDKRIVLIQNKENIKIAQSLNKGLSIARGEYILRMDGDDISELGRVKKMLSFLQRDSKIDLVGCQMVGIDENGKHINKTRLLCNEDHIYEITKFISPVPHIWLARRKIYELLDGYRNIPGAEDYDFLLRMQTNGLRFTNMDYYGYYVRIMRSGNSIDSLGIKQIKMSNYVYKMYCERKLSGVDSFSIQSLNEYLKTWKITVVLYNISTYFTNQAILSKSKRKWVYFFVFSFIAGIFSHYRLRFVINRIRLKIKLVMISRKKTLSTTSNL